jgi:hypothetical protein
MHQSEIERIGGEGEGEVLAHHGRRISLVMPVGMRRSDEKFPRPRCDSSEEGERGEGRSSWGFYRRLQLAAGARVFADLIGWLGGCRAPAGFLPEEEEGFQQVGPGSLQLGEGEDTDLVSCPGGLWAESRTGLVWSPWPFSLFSIFFSFFGFSEFFQIFYKLASNQIKQIPRAFK